MQSLHPPGLTRHLHEHDVEALAPRPPGRRRSTAGAVARFLEAVRVRRLEKAGECGVRDPQAENA